MNKEFRLVKKGDVFRGLGAPASGPFVTAQTDAVFSTERGICTVIVPAGHWNALGQFRVECKFPVI